jgi:hypothetical protein
LALEDEGISYVGQPSRQGSALFSVRLELWRSARADSSTMQLKEQLKALLADPDFYEEWD